MSQRVCWIVLDFEPDAIGFWAIVCQVKYPVLFLSGKASSTALSARDPVSLSESRRKLGSASKPKLPNKAGSKISGRGIKNRRLNGWRPAPGEAQEPWRQSESEPSCRPSRSYPVFAPYGIECLGVEYSRSKWISYFPMFAARGELQGAAQKSNAATLCLDFSARLIDDSHCPGRRSHGRETFSIRRDEESSEPGGRGMSPNLNLGTQRERLGTLRETALPEGSCEVASEAFEAGKIDRSSLRTEGGGARRRRARRLLSTTIHSTFSLAENSIAWAIAEGKLMYHCSLVLRLMS